MDQIKIYLDTNVVSNLKNKGKLSGVNKDVYDELDYILENNKDLIVLPYSPAHLNDLKKSYYKGDIDKTYESLSFLSTLTKDLCMAQYWGNDCAYLHTRNTTDFFDEVIEEKENLYSIEEIERIVNKTMPVNIFDMFKQIPHHIDFERLRSSENPNDQILLPLLPNAERENTIYAVLKDFFDMLIKVKSDPNIYNTLTSVFKGMISLHPNLNNLESIVEQLDPLLAKTPINKTFTDLFPKNNSATTGNNHYHDILSTYMRLDFVGYNSEKLNNKNNYDNLFNDALHCFYAAHCHFYLTEDKKNYKKSKAIFSTESYGTAVFKPKEFIDHIKSMN